MAVSGSFDLNSVSLEIINDALEYCGKRDILQTTTAEVTNTCRRTFNYMLKFWQSKEIGLWLIEDLTLFFQDDTASYDIYASGTNATTSFVKTEVATAGAATDTTVEVDSVTGFGNTLDRDGIITAVTPSGSGAITLDGALVANSVASLTSERKLLIYSDGDDSGVTFAVTGTDAVGNSVTESITGPNTTTVYSANEYKAVTQITISGAGTGNIEVGQVGDHVGIELDDGTIQWTTLSGAPATTLPIVDALTDAVSVDANIYTYTVKAQKPLELSEARLYQDPGTEYPIHISSRDEYLRLSDKTAEGKPTQVYPDFRIDRCTLYVWPRPDSVKDYLKLSVRRRLDDIDGLTENLSLPPEWLLTLSTNLAYWIAPKFGVNLEKIAVLREYAQETLDSLMMFDQEETSFRIEPK